MSRLYDFLLPRDPVRHGLRGRAGPLADLVALELTPMELAVEHYHYTPFNPATEMMRQGRADLLAWLAQAAPAHFDRGFANELTEGASYARSFAQRPNWEIFEALRSSLPAEKIRQDFAAFQPALRGFSPDPDAPIHILAWEGCLLDSAAAVAAARWLGPEIAELPNQEGMTPLMLAAQSQCAEMAGAFLELGANPHAENKWGQSAMSLAQEWSRGDQGAFAVFEREGLKAFLDHLAEPAESAPPQARPRARL